MHGVTITSDQSFAVAAGNLPIPEPPLGEPQYNTAGLYIGTKDDNSRLAGTWMALFTSLNAPATYAGMTTDTGHIMAYIRPDGFCRCIGQSSGIGDGMIDVTPWDGWMLRIRPNVYFYALGTPGAPGYGCALYEVILNRSGDVAIATMICDEGCGNPAARFWENNIFIKVSDYIDEKPYADVRAVSDQWLK